MTAAEVAAAVYARPAPTPLPNAGDTVLYRHDEHGDVTDATVLVGPDLKDRTDPNVWDERGGKYILRPDPWPLLTLSTIHGAVLTREARVRGAAGWLPANFD